MNTCTCIYLFKKVLYENVHIANINLYSSCVLSFIWFSLYFVVFLLNLRKLMKPAME